VTIQDFSATLAQAAGRGARLTAVGLASAGVPVFPCTSGGKRPLTAHGFLDATTDQRLVAAWWRAWPKANIGMPTGPISGWDVVDVDVRPSGDGRQAFQNLAGRAGADGWVFKVGTPSGGLHYYYPADPTRPQASWACGAAHMDFRGAGGYIIIPPSATNQPGGQRVPYRLSDAREAGTPVDASRLRGLLDPQFARRRLSARVGGQMLDMDVSRLADWVAGRPEGERNQGLFWASCRLVEAGHGVAQALSALAPAAAQAGLLDREISLTVASAFRHTQPAPLATSTAPASSPALVAPREAVVL